MENKELLNSLERCGHFLYHRRGGKWGQKRILRLVAEKGSLSQKELQDILNIKAGSLSELVTKIEAEGFINKERDKNDKRRLILKITPLGEEFLKKAEEQNKAQEERLFESLTEEEQIKLQALMNKLLSSWEETFGAELFGKRHKERGGAKNV